MAFLTVNFRSEILLQDVTVNAIVPFDRGGVPQGGFQTLYLLHGLTGDRNSWLLNSRIFQWAQERRLAVILPDGRNMFYLNNEATLDRYGDFTGRELVEASRMLFPLSDKREDTFIAGLSMGGYGAIRNGLQYGDTFGCAAGMSAALIMEWLADPVWERSREPYHERTAFGGREKILGTDKDPQALVARRLAAGEPMPRLYISCGTEDALIGPNRALHQYLLKQGVEHMYREGPGAHDWDFWNGEIRRVLDWLPLRGTK